MYEEPKKNLSNKADWCLVLTGFGLFPDSISGVDQKCHFQLHNSMVKKVPVGKEPIKAYPVWVFWFNTQKRRQFFRQIHHCMMSRQEKGITRDLSHLLHHLLILQWVIIRTKCFNFYGENLWFLRYFGSCHDEFTFCKIRALFWKQPEVFLVQKCNLSYIYVLWVLLHNSIGWMGIKNQLS